MVLKEDNKMKYIPPEMEIIEFDSDDIITASGPEIDDPYTGPYVP